MIQDGDVSDPTFSTSLRSSVLVTGALLVGTGYCTVVGNIISVGASIQTPFSGKIIIKCALPNSRLLNFIFVIMIAAVSAEDFLNSSSSAVEQRAFVLATTLFQEEDTTYTAVVLNSGEITGIVVAAIVFVFLLMAVITVICVYVYYISRKPKR